MAPHRRKILNYSEEQMLNALQDVQRGMAVATAARKNNVPRISLYYKVKGERPPGRKMGPDPILKKDEEEIIVSWIISLSRAGFPVTKDEVLDSVQHILLELDRGNCFVNNRPGRSWFKLFLLRNPIISTRVAQNLTVSRASVQREDILQWHSSTFNYLAANNYENILSDPSRVFNGDESAFFLNPKGSKVLACKGDKNVYQQVNSDEKECVTVLITANADGQLAPPLVVFKYERIPSDIAQSVPPSWGIGKSESGWMNGALFYEFLANVFHPWLLKNNITLPIILFIDGHSSHLTLHTSKFCDESGIILVALHPNATHLIQPMDVSVFRSLKGKWKDKVHDWRFRNMEKPILKRRDFSPLLKEVLDEINPSIIKNGFKKCGISPWDSTMIMSTSTNEETPRPNRSFKNTTTTTRDALKVVEELIGSSKVKSFRDSDLWLGSNEDKSLFYLWKKMKNLEEKELQETNNCRETQLSSTSQIITAEITQHIEKSHTENTMTTEVLSPPMSTSQPETADDIGSLLKPKNVPSPFKRVLFWPEVSSTCTKKRKKETLPSVVTSESWRNYHESKAKKKLEMEDAKRIRALEREKKKQEKEELKESKKKQKELQKRKKVTELNKNGNNKMKIQPKKKRGAISSSESDNEEWQPSGSSIDDVSLGISELSFTDFSNNNEEKEGYVLVNSDEKDFNNNEDLSLLKLDEITPDTWEFDDISIEGVDLQHFECFSNEKVQSQICIKSLEGMSYEQEKEGRDVSNAMLREKEMKSHIETQISADGNMKRHHFSKVAEKKNHEGILETIMKGSYIVALFVMKNKESFKYVCQILTIGNDSITVVTLKPVSRIGNVFIKNKKDVREISASQLINVLPFPTTFGTGENKKYHFSFSPLKRVVSTYN